jgi:hypothetical protein
MAGSGQRSGAAGCLIWTSTDVCQRSQKKPPIDGQTAGPEAPEEIMSTAENLTILNAGLNSIAKRKGEIEALLSILDNQLRRQSAELESTARVAEQIAGCIPAIPTLQKPSTEAILQAAQ